MRVLHLNTYDIEGGAARAAYRLHRALLAENIDSKMLVQTKKSDDYTVFGPKTRKEEFYNLLRPAIDYFPVKYYKNRTQTLFSPAWFPSNIIKKINSINPDIVHLHWICGGLLRLEQLKKINVPIVWTLHDMWAFTGGEHIDEGQGHYFDKCGSSKVLGSNKENDLSRKGWLRKKKVYDAIGDFSVVGVSEWIHNQAKESSLLKSKKHFQLPNLLNTAVFKPLDKKNVRNIWNLPLNKKIILFGAIGVASDPNKGFKQLSEALNLLDKNLAIEFVVFGASKPKNPPNFGFKVHYLGRLTDNESLVTLYSCADVMVVPSLKESFGQTASESLSCGTPVVAFDTTGLKDIVDHKQNGYLAEPFDVKDLARGIEWVLHSKKYKELSNNARKKVVETFSEEVVIPKYINLYKSILDD